MKKLIIAGVFALFAHSAWAADTLACRQQKTKDATIVKWQCSYPSADLNAAYQAVRQDERLNREWLPEKLPTQSSRQKTPLEKCEEAPEHEPFTLQEIKRTAKRVTLRYESEDCASAIWNVLKLTRQGKRVNIEYQAYQP